MKKIVLTIAAITVLGFGLLITSCEKAPVPTAIFSTTIDGLDATFTNYSKDADSYAWNFGDGGSSSDVSPTHTFAENGDYLVSMTATGEGGENTMTETVTIDASSIVGTWAIDSSFQRATAYGTYTQDTPVPSAAATAPWAIYIFTGLTDTVSTSCVLELVEDGTVLVNGAASTTTWSEENGVATFVSGTYPGVQITGELNDLEHLVIEAVNLGLLSTFPAEIIPEQAAPYVDVTNVDLYRFITSLVE